jgi:hypothetical protein
VKLVLLDLTVQMVLMDCGGATGIKGNKGDTGLAGLMVQMELMV